MKKKLLVIAMLLCVAICTVLIAACGNTTVHVTSVTLNKTELTLEEGETETLIATVLPDNAKYKTVSWTVEQQYETIYVENNGKITALSQGTAVVIATADYVSAQCTVTVKAPPVPVNSVILSESNLKLKSNEDHDLTVRILPEEAAGNTVTWTIEPQGVATVDSNGRVHAIKQGSAIITASVDDIHAECNLVVSDDELHYELNGDGQSYMVRYTYTSTLTDAVVAAEYNGKPVTKIHDSAFLNCSDNLVSITIPATVSDFSFSSLFHCRKLEEITADTDNATYSSQGGVLYNKDKTVIEYVPYGIKGKVTIPYGVTSVDSFSSRDAITEIDMPDSVTEIGEWAFQGCTSLESITIPKNVKTLGFASFSGCTSLTQVILPDDLERIENNSFTSCAITSITIPRKVNYIGSMAFCYCANLTSIHFQGTRAEWDAITKGDSWDSGTSNYTLYCQD